MSIESLLAFGILFAILVWLGLRSQKELKDIGASNARINTELEKKNQEMKYQLGEQEIEIQYLKSKLEQEKYTLKKEKEITARMREYRELSDSWSAKYFKVADKLDRVTVVEQKVLENVDIQRSSLKKNILTTEDREVVKLSLKANKNKMLRNPVVYSELLLGLDTFEIVISSINKILED